MPIPSRNPLSRRATIAALTALVAAPACAANPKVTSLKVYRDAACGCCGAWVTALEKSKNLRTTIEIVDNIAGVKARLGVPDALSSCHTATAGAYLFEGHVPPDDIVRFLAAPPKGKIGLAVPGMPVGSPGMEMPDGRRQSFDVLAFDKQGRHMVFASYT